MSRYKALWLKGLEFAEFADALESVGEDLLARKILNHQPHQEEWPIHDDVSIEMRLDSIKMAMELQEPTEIRLSESEYRVAIEAMEKYHEEEIGPEWLEKVLSREATG